MCLFIQLKNYEESFFILLDILYCLLGTEGGLFYNIIVFQKQQNCVFI